MHRYKKIRVFTINYYFEVCIRNYESIYLVSILQLIISCPVFMGNGTTGSYGEKRIYLESDKARFEFQTCH